MISFLRKIRQQLLQQNRVTRYLVYATGEIFLVVIGILIALSINNWNESNQLEREELQLLEEMAVELEEQQKDLIFNIGYHETAKNSAELLLSLLQNQGGYHDSLKQHFLNVYQFTVLNNRQNAFAALKSKGITLIQNDSLRFIISGYYEERIPLQLLAQEVSMKQNVEQSHLHLELFKGFSWKDPFEPWDFEELKNNRAYLSWLSYVIGNRSFEISSFNLTLERNQQLIAAIREELSRRK
ncbi:DUF6090 family protein [Algoriphagus namhaensis]